MTSDRLETLQTLLSEGQIAGYALISHLGCVEAAFGSLEDALWPDGGAAGASPAAQQLLAAFGPAPPQHLTVAGRALVVVRQDDGYVFAVAPQAALSLHHTTSGILAVSYSKTQARAGPGRVREALGG